MVLLLLEISCTGSYLLCFDVFSRRYIREALPKRWGEVSPCSPEIKGRVPLPTPPSKIRYLMFPVPHYYLYSSVSIKSWPYFPRSREINAIFPVPKTPAITFFLIIILLIEKKHKRSRSNVLYDDSSGSSSKTGKRIKGPPSFVRESSVHLTPQK